MHDQMATVSLQHASVTATMIVLITVMKLAAVCCLHKWDRLVVPMILIQFCVVLFASQDLQ